MWLLIQLLEKLPSAPMTQLLGAFCMRLRFTTLDVVDAKIPHGLSKPELSLVAVPGIPETNIQVLEHLKESLAHQDHGKVKLKAKEALGEAEVFCVFCSNPADYFVSICQPCVDKFSVPVDNFVGVEKLEEKDIENISEKVAAKIGEKSSLEVEKLKIELSEAKAKLAEAEGKVKVAEGACIEVNGKLTVANKTIEDLKKLMPGLDLLVDPPVLMAVSEALSDFQSLRLSPMVENCSGFSQHMGMDIRNKILKYEAKLRVK
jgi:uncharacterized protein YwlG (UPF0340 family)